MTKPASRPGSEVRAAAPALTRIADELNVLLTPAMTATRPGDLAQAGWMLAKALRILAVAARSADPADRDKALAETGTDLQAAAGHIRDARAAGTGLLWLGQAGKDDRHSNFEAGDPVPCAAVIHKALSYRSARVGGLPGSPGRGSGPLDHRTGPSRSRFGHPGG